MLISPEIYNFIERLQHELEQIEQNAVETLNLIQTRLMSYPNNYSFVQTYAIIGNYIIFVEVSRRRIDSTRIVLMSDELTKEQIREAGETLSELL